MPLTECPRVDSVTMAARAGDLRSYQPGPVALSPQLDTTHRTLSIFTHRVNATMQILDTSAVISSSLFLPPDSFACLCLPVLLVSKATILCFKQHLTPGN